MEDDTGQHDPIEDFACFLNLALFVTLVASEVYVLIRIKYDIDKPAKITLYIYTMSAILQTVTWI